MKRPACVAIALAMAFALSALAAPSLALPGAPAPPTVVGRVDLGAIAPVDVNKDAETLVVANGTVNVTIPGGFTVETRTNITAQVNNTDWITTVTPATMSLMGSGEIAFQVNITVPGRVASDAGALLFVVANVTLVGAPPLVSRIYSATTAVPIVQYFGLSLSGATPASPEEFTAHAGNQTSFAIRLQNLGNGRDSFELSVQNIAELQGQGIGVTLPTPVSVAKGGVVNINGNVSLPATVTSGNFTITFGGLSTGAAAKGQAVTAVADKRFAALPPEVPDPAVDGPGGGAGKGGFLPGPDALMIVGALAAAAVVAVGLRRVTRP